MQNQFPRSDFWKAVVAGLVAIALLFALQFEEEAVKKAASAGTETFTASSLGFGGNVTATLTMKDGVIKAVSLEGPGETPAIGGEALKTLKDQVLTAQSADIDGVSGASLTSEGVRNAVAKALAEARGEAIEGNVPAEGELFVPGTYEAAAKGFGGDVNVTVTVTGTEIESITVGDHHETANIGTFAIEQQPVSMVENQTCNIDALSGATVTSNALKNAVAKALTEAGADVTKLPVITAPVLTADQKAQETVDVDVVVVGAGGAGMSAAINAKQAGKNVIIVEKMPYVGGNTTKATGGMNAAETDYQDAIEFKNAAAVEKQLATAAEKWADHEVITALAEKVAEQWAEYQANPVGYFDTNELMELDTIIGGHGINDPALVEKMVTSTADAIKWLDSINAPLPKVSFSGGASVSRIHAPADGGAVGVFLVTEFRRVLNEMGIEVMYNTKATEILMADGKAAGIKAESADTIYTINADAVILATGGFGANKDMLVSFDETLKNAVTTNAPGATGDGIVMAQAVGAGVRDLEQIQQHPTVEQSTSMLITEGVRGDGAILVNKDGVRFANEMLTRDALSAEEKKQEDGLIYIIFDDALRGRMKAVEKYVSSGIVTEAATPEELAAKIGLDPAVLAKTLADWNECVANEEDTLFGRATGMEYDLTTAPYYAIKLAPGIHHTMGGVTINTNAEVLDTAGYVIPGLFAAGEVTGGVHGGNRLGGTAVCDIVVFGRIAGQNAAAYCG